MATRLVRWKEAAVVMSTTAIDAASSEGDTKGAGSAKSETPRVVSVDGVGWISCC